MDIILKEEDPRLGMILKQSDQGEFVIIGFPYDIGDRRAQQKTGSDYGPDTLFTRFLPKVGPLINAEYSINIASLNISVMGSIGTKAKDIQLEQILHLLQENNIKLLNLNKIPIVIGGSKDLIYACFNAMIKQAKPSKKIGLFKISSILECEQGSQINSQNSMRMLLQENKDLLIKDSNISVQYFGVHDNKILPKDIDTLAPFSKNINIVKFSQIKAFEFKLNSNDIHEPCTQAANYYKELLQKFEEKNDQIHLSISLEALNAANCPGVGNPSLTSGLSNEEAIEIMFLSGQCSKIISLDISDYNSGQEDFITGRLLGNLIYYFLMGKAYAKNK